MSRIGRISISVAIFCLITNFCLADSSKPLIFPIPQQMQVTGDSFPITDQTVIAIPEKPAQQDTFLAKFLTTELADRFGFAIKTVRTSNLPDNKNIILAGTVSNPLVKQYCKKNKIALSPTDPGAEGYALNVSKNIVFIGGSDEAGALYGVQSLRQLICKKDGKLTVTAVHVRDWPYKPFRGLRIYVPGKDSLQFFKRFLRDFMSLYKYNKVILEVNAVMRFDKHPELNIGASEFAKSMIYTRRDRPKSPHNVIQDSAHYDAGDYGLLEKQELADIVQYARQHNIDVIPEIPSLTHSYYLLFHHRDLAEIQDAEWPDTYCPSNPKSYELLFDVLDEYIEVIKPNMVHIGHDEWRMPVGTCEKCKGKKTSDLFMQDVTKIYNHLKTKNVKVAMWGDHLMESVRGKELNWGSSAIFPGDVWTEKKARQVDPNAYIYNLPGAMPEQQVRDSIPKDILIFNWFWSKTQEIEGVWSGGEKNDLKLQDMGFKQVYGNFEANIQNWAERTKRPSIIGGASSSWSATTEFNFGKDQMIDFLGCANLLWSTHWPDRPELIEIVRDRTPQIRKYISGKTDPSCDGDSAVPIDLAQHFNVARCDQIVSANLCNLRGGTITANKKIFNVVDANSDVKCAIAVATKGTGLITLPNEISGIKIGKDVTSLIFLHACQKPARNFLTYTLLYNFPDTADLLGWYEIVYEDGFVETIPLRYGVNILEWNQSSENYCYAAKRINCAKENSDKPLYFYAFELTNARLGKKIEQINLRGTTGFKAPKTGQLIEDNAIVLLAISTLEKRQIPPNP